jgi:hypothetical protein
MGVDTNFVSKLHMENLLTQNRSIYRLKDTDLMISVHDQYLRDIRESVVEYGTLQNVPPHLHIRGIVFKVLNEHLSELRYNGSEIQIPINRLEFDVDNSRLTA